MKICESNADRLSALADGELTGWAAWRLRRHVAGCAGCAAELADWQRMNSTLRAADVAPELGHAIRDPRPKQRIALARYLVAGAAVTAAVFGGIFYAAPTQPVSGVAAQAAVEDAMSQIRTAKWHKTEYVYDKHGKMMITAVSEYSARLDPPTLIRRERRNLTTPKSPPYSSSYSSIIRSDAREMDFYDESPKPGSLMIFRTAKSRWDLVPPSVEGESAYQRMRRTVTRSMFASLDAEKEREAKPYYHRDGSPELVPIEPTLRHITRNGRQLIEIREGNEFWFAGKDNGTGWYEVIRADAFTHRIVETDTEVVRLSTKRVLHGSHSDGYTYNQPLLPGTFDLNVPHGGYLRVDGRWIVSPWPK